MAAKRIPKSPRKTAKAEGELKVFRALQRAPVAMSKDQAAEIDEKFMTGGYGVGRRIGLLVYMLSEKDLIGKIKSDRDYRGCAC